MAKESMNAIILGVQKTSNFRPENLVPSADPEQQIELPIPDQPTEDEKPHYMTDMYIYIIDYKYKTNQVNIGESGDITSISSSNHSKFKPPNLSTFNALAWYLAWDLRRLEQLGSNEDLKDFWDSTSKVSPGPNSTKGTNHHPVHAKQNHQKPTNISWKKQWFWWWELRSFQRKTSQELGNLSRGRRVDLDLFRWETQRKGMLFVFGEWLWVKRHEKKKRIFFTSASTTSHFDDFSDSSRSCSDVFDHVTIGRSFILSANCRKQNGMRYSMHSVLGFKCPTFKRSFKRVEFNMNSTTVFTEDDTPCKAQEA